VPAFDPKGEGGLGTQRLLRSSRRSRAPWRMRGSPSACYVWCVWSA